MTQRFVVLTTVLLMACGASQQASRPRPAYADQGKALFDDSIDPAAVGLDLDKGYNPAADPTFAARVREADGIVRAKVLTITARTSEERSTYQISLAQLEEQSLGPYPPKSPFTIKIDSSSPSVGIVKHLEGGLVGKTFVVFTKEFQRGDGDIELHVHLAPDTKTTIRAISDARAREEVKH